MSFHAAFYTGTRPGMAGVYNRIGRRLGGRYTEGNGRYSHMEFAYSDGMSWSASFEDKGIRGKFIGYSTITAWDFLRLPDQWEQPSREWMQAHEGLGYDWFGQLQFVLGFARTAHPVKRWCSEACIESVAQQLGLGRTPLCSPDEAWDLLRAAGCAYVPFIHGHLQKQERTAP